MTNAETNREPGLLDRYWRSNVRIMLTLLLLWLLAGVVAGVLAADWLNQFRLPGTGIPLGFWFAQQGSIVAFVFLILAYCLLMNRLDRKHHADVDAASRQVQGGNR